MSSFRCHYCGRRWGGDICDDCADELERQYAERQQDEEEYWERRHREQVENEQTDRATSRWLERDEVSGTKL